MEKWYIYVHLRSDTKEPFYIGKGIGKRAFNKRCRSFHWNNIVSKHGYDVCFVEIELTEQDANKREVYWIGKIGRRDLGNGPLVNFTNGGEGSSGRPMNDHTKKVLSDCNKNRPSSQIQKNIVGSRYKGRFGKDHNRSVAVICNETGVQYGSMSEAERELNWGQGGVKWSMKFNRPIYGKTFRKAV